MHEKERRLREAQEVAHLGFWRWNVKTGDVEWSDEVYKIFCLNPKEYTPHIDTILALSPWPNDNQRNQELIKHVTETHSPGFFEQKFLRPDQSIGHCFSTFQGNFDENGDLIFIVGTLLDITERKKAEEKLMESEKRLLMTLEVTKIGIWDWDIKKDIWYASAMFYTMLGYEPVSGPADRGVWLERAHPDERAAIEEKIKNVLLGTAIDYQYEARARHSDGSYRWHNVIGNAIEWDKDGKPSRLIGVRIDITDRKQAEKALRDSEEKYRSIYENIQDVYYETLSDGKIIEISPSIEVISKGLYKQQDLIGKSMYDFYPDIAIREKLIATMQKSGRVSDYELQLINRDGSLIQCSVSAKLSFNSEGGIEKIIGSLHDITERKKADDIILKERTLLRTLIDNLPNGVFVKDKEYRKIIVNPIHIKDVDGHLKYLGMNTEIDILGKTDFEVFPKEIAEKFFIDDMKVICDGAVILNNIGTGYYEDGRQLWLLVSKIPLRDKKGEIIGMVGVTLDITERKQAEEALKTSEEKFRTIFDNANDGMFLLSPDTINFIMCNLSCSKMLGYSSDEFLDLDISLILPSDELPVIHGQIQKLLRDELGARIDIKFRRKDGTVFTADLSSTIVTIENKKLVLIVFRDITERLLKESELSLAKEKAEESDKLKTSFLHNISHEIRTPLNGIIGFSDMIANPNISSEKRMQFSQIIRSSSDQLISIVDDIISIATIETGNEKPHEKESDINKLLQFLKSQNLHKIESKNLSFIVSSSLTDDEAFVMVDQAKLLQILNQLISNSAKFTLEGFIKINCTLDGNFIKFIVEDTGIGIPPEMQERIFDRFFQIDYGDTRTYGGTGLGLTIVKSYVNFLSGEIHLDSKPGKGSMFIISIPYKPVKQIKHLNKPVNENLENIGPATILIADDELANFELLREFLSDLNLTIIHVENGLQAVEACKNNPSISLVLMDVKMPKMDGYEAARQIKEFRPRLPIIVQTAYIFQNEREESMSTYIDGFIEKPINQAILLETLRTKFLDRPSQ
jgi:PAS domain S-box-containing protein